MFCGSGLRAVSQLLTSLIIEWMQEDILKHIVSDIVLYVV